MASSDNTDDDLRMVLTHVGVSACPHNMTVLRVGLELVDHLDAQGSTTYGCRILRLEHFEDRRAPFIGVFINGDFVPMFMVCMSEFAERFGTYCGGEHCNHLECQNVLRPDSRMEKPKAEIDTAFAPMAETLMDELPSYSELLGYYPDHPDK